MALEIDAQLLQEFENGLDPVKLERSRLPAKVLGYGEISTVFQIGDNDQVAFKRMPLFRERAGAEKYAKDYENYCNYLREAGLELPPDSTHIIERPDGVVVFYIAQQQLPPDRFGHKLIQHDEQVDLEALLGRIVEAIHRIWVFNAAHRPEVEIALDGQLSNWVWLEDDRLLYIDTSTPLYRLQGVEQLDPELFLQSAPGFLRWLIRWLFLSDVMNRYYDERQVFIDLAANLFKEQRPDLVPVVVELINKRLPEGIEPLSVEEVDKYYREDKLIWALFLAFRRFDRWLKTVLLRRRYEFILPGKIKR